MKKWVFTSLFLAIGFLTMFTDIVLAEVLKYDDGTRELTCSPWTDEVGSEIAVRFTPPTYPVTLKKVQFFIPRVREYTTQFGVRIYDGDNGLYPGSRLDQGNFFGAATVGDEWVEVDVSSEEITIIEGDFFVSMYWLKAPGRGGEFAQFLGHDQDQPIHERGLWKHGDSGTWFYLFEGHGCYGNPMIRTVVEFGPAPSSPICDILMSQASYVNGETVTAQVLRIANPTATPLAVELKLWFDVPTIPPVSFVNIGANGDVVLPAGFDQNFGPLSLFTVTEAFPRGTYGFNCRILHPVTGGLLVEDLNPFDIQ